MHLDGAYRKRLVHRGTLDPFACARTATARPAVRPRVSRGGVRYFAGDGAIGAGIVVSGITQDERSKSMNSSAFSWGDRSLAASQPLGGGNPAAPPPIPTPPPFPVSMMRGLPETCRSL